jgi:hypothetical protein
MSRNAISAKRICCVAAAVFGIAPSPGGAQQTPIPDILLLEVGDYGDARMIRRSAALDGFRSWVAASDYPATALRDRRKAEVYIDVAVGPTDEITACTVTLIQGDRDDVFGRTACAIVSERGHFRHALDAEGNAQPGVVPMVMTFTLREAGQPSYSPGPAPEMGPALKGRPIPREGALTLNGGIETFPNRSPSAWLDIGDDGRVRRCRIRATTGTDAGDTKLCHHAMSARFEPATDVRGRSVAVSAFFAQFVVES